MRVLTWIHYQSVTHLISNDIIICSHDIMFPTGGIGDTLVHSKQKEYLHQLLQSRLFTDQSPIMDLCDTLRILQLVYVVYQDPVLISEVARLSRCPY